MIKIIEKIAHQRERISHCRSLIVLFFQSIAELKEECFLEFQSSVRLFKCRSVFGKMNIDKGFLSSHESERLDEALRKIFLHKSCDMPKNMRLDALEKFLIEPSFCDFLTARIDRAKSEFFLSFFFQFYLWMRHRKLLSEEADPPEDVELFIERNLVFQPLGVLEPNQIQSACLIAELRGESFLSSSVGDFF